MDDPNNTGHVVQGRPPKKQETFIREKYLESIADQPALMDGISKQLLTLELAIPGLYASILKLVSGDKATISHSTLLYMSFAFWIISLVCIVFALLPRIYDVQSNDFESMRQFFHKSAFYKYTLILASTITFVIGLFLLIVDIVS